MTAGFATIVLAGGRSSRIGGGDKTLLELAPGVSLIEVILARLGTTPIAINANGDPARFARFGLPIVADPVAGLPGPLAGILAGLEWAGPLGVARLLTVAGDTPFLPRDLAARLAAASDAETIAVAASGGRMHPVFALWPVGLAGTLRRHLETGQPRRVSAFIESNRHVGVDFAIDDVDGDPFDPFFNVNTPDDLARARLLFQKAKP